MTRETARYRLDHLRRLAASLGTAVGLAAARASALATHLLWFDAAGAAPFGIGTLPSWLERLETRQVEPSAEGKVTSEMSGTAVLDGQNGVPPMILARAGELATEKARDAGVGLVRVIRLGPGGPAAAVTAEMAIGPYAGLALGPGGEWSVALPSELGLPAVFDSALGGPQAAAPALLAPWTQVLAPSGGWLIAAIAVAALEPLATWHERLGEALKEEDPATGQLAPHDWEARRREAREHGITVSATAWKSLKQWAERLQVDLPAPIAPPLAAKSSGKSP